MANNPILDTYRQAIDSLKPSGSGASFQTKRMMQEAGIGFNAPQQPMVNPNAQALDSYRSAPSDILGNGAANMANIERKIADRRAKGISVEDATNDAWVMRLKAQGSTPLQQHIATGVIKAPEGNKYHVAPEPKKSGWFGF